VIGSFGVADNVGIIAVVLLLFGAKLLPEIGRGLGGAIGLLRRALTDDTPQRLSGRGGGRADRAATSTPPIKKRPLR
jgi:TatA/E family protein of Tat protein translocase